MRAGGAMRGFERGRDVRSRAEAGISQAHGAQMLERAFIFCSALRLEERGRVAVEPEAHDRLVALTSHLPHALANLLVNQAGATRVEGHEPLAAAGGSLRDMTRVAGANPRIWVDIFVENAAPLRESLAEHRRRIEQLEAALEAGDAGFLARWIGEAAGNRRQMLADAYPDPGQLHQLRVHVPDRPGVLAAITQALGAQRINIEDFELHHVSPERGGTLTLLVTGKNEAERAAALLESQGYGVVVSPVLAP